MLNNSDKGLSDNRKNLSFDKTSEREHMKQIDLSKEERQKLKELQENPPFKKDWNILKICIYKSHPIPSIFILCLLIFFACILYCFSILSAYSLYELIDYFDDSTWFGISILLVIPIFILAIVAWGIIILLITKLIEKQLKNFSPREIYLKRSLPPTINIILPYSEFNEEKLPTKSLKKALPNFSYYLQSGLLKLQHQNNLQITDLYAYSPKKKKVGTHAYEFKGQIFSFNYSSHFDGQLRVIPSDKLLEKGRNRGNFAPCEGEIKIDVKDIPHNENYDIYCSNIEAARNFLTPAMLAWFDKQVPRGLTFFLTGNHIYLAIQSNLIIFDPPKNIAAWNKWNIEEIAWRIKAMTQTAMQLTEIFQ